MADNPNNWLGELLRALQADSAAAPRQGGLLGQLGAPPPTVPLSGLFSPVPPPQPNALGGLLSSPAFGLTPPPQPSALGGPLSGYLPSLGVQPPPPTPLAPLPLAPPVRRRVFFSFHYEDDIRRACIVRQSWRFRPAAGALTPANFFDNSLWEKSRRQNEESLKRLIRAGMEQSTVTCVLAGTNTWLRPWVRFEIAHSLFRKNGIFAVAIHNISNPRGGPSAPGRNPLDHMGLVMRADGRGDVWEAWDGGWRPFSLARRPVPWPAWLPTVEIGAGRLLSDGAPTYDYMLDDGNRNLPHWADWAAQAAKRR